MNKKCSWDKDDGSITTSFEDNGTIERIQQLLENLDQRGQNNDSMKLFF